MQVRRRMRDSARRRRPAPALREPDLGEVLAGDDADYSSCQLRRHHVRGWFMYRVECVVGAQVKESHP